MKKLLLFLVIAGLVVFGLIQLIPVNRTNPAVTLEPDWASPEDRALIMEHCGDCHSNETKWPWYNKIAPGSWLISWDVEKGRREFNFSEWDKKPGNLDEMAEQIREGEMPPFQYTLIHGNSRLGAQQKEALITALGNLYK